MNRRPETNPHFVRLSQLPQPDADHRLSPTSSSGPQLHDDGGPSQLPGHGKHGKRPHKHGKHSDKHDLRPHKHSHHRHKDDHTRRPSQQPAPVPLAPPIPHYRDDQHRQPPRPHDEESHQPHSSSVVTVVPPPSHEDQLPKPFSHPTHQDQQRPWSRSSPAQFTRHHEEPQQHAVGPRMPVPHPTKALTWCAAVFCVIFWIVIILGGLAVLIVYLVFRPRSPRFEVSTATLNAAYLDMGYLLNADLTVLANFTNPNRKVSVEFNYMYIELYYGRTLIATQYIEPFSAPKAETRFANLHMVTSQVRLSELEIQRLKRQMMNNNVLFDVKGFFKARSNFGGLLRYSYWLHGRCTIMVARPPDGVLLARKCKTKH